MKWVFPPQSTQLRKSLTGMPMGQPDKDQFLLQPHSQVILDLIKLTIGLGSGGACL